MRLRETFENSARRLRCSFGEGAVRLQAAFAFKSELGEGKMLAKGLHLHLFVCVKCVFKKKGNKENFCSLAF